ncbi:WxL domain-containing protein [Lactiplantibacillus plantarum]|uniref:WxL domain-containing protein n=1 Tax=Lactiplantibacillus plantarum TaxID=1590 RepID=UPI00217DA227|nr:WxL domain-containing protein [Lactiplantibacillus plantarum]MCS6157607.1 WxL domain-containing protein [Lactiplantibacillus plantarum]
MEKFVLGLMISAGLLGATTVVANADTTGSSTGDVTFTGGTLSMSVDATNLAFGSNTISSSDATLATSSTPTVTVSDLRGTSAGWNLTVAQGQQFNTALNGTGSALINAALTVAGTESDSAVTNGSTTLTPGTTSAAGAAGTVASAKNGTGNGASTVTFSDSKLAVPGKTTKLATGYTTTLTWNLNDTPGN